MQDLLTAAYDPIFYLHHSYVDRQLAFWQELNKLRKREIGVWGFQIYGDCMLPTIPVIFEINTLCGLLISTLNHDFFFQISLQFLRGF